MIKKHSRTYPLDEVADCLAPTDNVIDNIILYQITDKKKIDNERCYFSDSSEYVEKIDGGLVSSPSVYHRSSVTPQFKQQDLKSF